MKRAEPNMALPPVGGQPMTKQLKPSTPQWRRVLGVLFAALLTLAMMALGVYALANSGLDVFKVQSAVSKLRLYGAAVQILIVALIGLRWDALVRWGRRCGFVLDKEFDRVVALRAKAMAFLCAYLILIPIGPQTLFKLLGMG